MSETQLKHEEMERQLASVDLSILTKHLLPSEYVYDEDMDAIWDVTELTEKVRRCEDSLHYRECTTILFAF